MEINSPSGIQECPQMFFYQRKQGVFLYPAECTGTHHSTHIPALSHSILEPLPEEQDINAESPSQLGGVQDSATVCKGSYRSGSKL